VTTRSNKQTLSAFGPPSSQLLRLFEPIAVQHEHPILDAGCGAGRNAVALAQRGLTVICADRDADRLARLAQFAPQYLLEHSIPGRRPGQLLPVRAELRRDRSLFRNGSLGAIVAIHFLDIAILECFSQSLVHGGHLFIETFGGHGENYLDLPKPGQLRAILQSDFDLVFYREKEVGPPSHRAVSVKLLGRRR
jgi:SAM-dependent methyltransferase